MKILNKDIIFAFSKDNKSAEKVSPGTEVVFETYDCFCNQLRTPEDKMEVLDWNGINPATGPVFVEGAEPGDLLKVEIKSIELNKKGTAVAGKDMGVLGSILDGVSTKIIDIDGDCAVFNDQIRIPLRKMIGVIGVASSGEPVNTGTPGSHGGNMDNTMIAEGATLYLPVSAPGALFGLGDVHAVMGDGEIGVSGLEIPADITVVFEVIKNKHFENPMLENEKQWSYIASAETLDAAAEAATEGMFRFLKERMDIEPNEVAMLMSLAGNLEVCQVVDPMKTMRFVIDKSIVGNLEI